MANEIDTAFLIKATIENNDEAPGVEGSQTKQNGKLGTSLNLGKMTIDEVYTLAKEFVRDKEGTKAMAGLTYDDRNMINVLTKQIKYLKFDPEKMGKVGFLDLVGKDRLQLWKSLGDLNKEQAMEKYINLVVRVCPVFTAHFEAHKRHLEELEELRNKQFDDEQTRRDMAQQKEKKLKEEDLKLFEENKKKREELQRKQIQEALNQQTYPHFKSYAEQQHPNNTLAQEELIKQLQEQHFEQYMNQVYQQQLLHQQQQAEQLKAMRKAQKKQDGVEDQLKRMALNTGDEQQSHSTAAAVAQSFNEQQSKSIVASSNAFASSLTSNGAYVAINNEKGGPSDRASSSASAAPAATAASGAKVNGEAAATATDDDENEEEEIELPPISAASMLTRKDIKEFKESVRKDNDAVIKVGSGETVTVRVPTHEDGRLVFWEFATDFYDLGFGLYFEWTISPSNNVTVHVSDSSEDEDGDERTEETGKLDPEKGDKASENKPPCDEIIPIFRRDCHEEVYAGSHLYPGRGVYLLKFDNSYSLWRSKTLYYRVYYSK